MRTLLSAVTFLLASQGCVSQCVNCGPQQQQPQNYQYVLNVPPSVYSQPRVTCCSPSQNYQQFQQSRTFTNGGQSSQVVMMYGGNGQQNTGVVSSFNAANQGPINYQNPGPIPPPMNGATVNPIYQNDQGPIIGGGITPGYTQGPIVGSTVTQGPTLGGNTMGPTTPYPNYNPSSPGQAPQGYTQVSQATFYGSTQQGGPNYQSTPYPSTQGPSGDTGNQPFVAPGNVPYNNNNQNPQGGFVGDNGQYNSPNAAFNDGQNFQVPPQQYQGQANPLPNQQLPPDFQGQPEFGNNPQQGYYPQQSSNPPPQGYNPQQGYNTQQGGVGPNGMEVMNNGPTSTPYPNQQYQGSTQGQDFSQGPYPAGQYVGSSSQQPGEQISYPAFNEDQPFNNGYSSTQNPTFDGINSQTTNPAYGPGGYQSTPNPNYNSNTFSTTSNPNFDPTLYQSTRNPNFPYGSDQPQTTSGQGYTSTMNPNFNANDQYTSQSPGVSSTGAPALNSNDQFNNQNQGFSSTGAPGYQSTTPYPDQGYGSTQNPNMYGGSSTPPSGQQGFYDQSTTPYTSTQNPSTQGNFQSTSGPSQQALNGQTPPGVQTSTFGPSSGSTIYGENQQGQYVTPQQNQFGPSQGAGPMGPSSTPMPQAQYPSQQEILASTGQQPISTGPGFSSSTQQPLPQPQFPSQQQLLSQSGQSPSPPPGPNGGPSAPPQQPEYHSQQELLARDQQQPSQSTIPPNGGPNRPPIDNVGGRVVKRLPGQPGYTPLYADQNMNTQYGRYNGSMQATGQPQFDQPLQSPPNSSGRVSSLLLATFLAILFW